MRNSKKKEKKRLQKKESRRTPKMTPHCSCENKGKLFKNHAGSAHKQFHVNLLGPEQSTPPKIASMLLLLLPFSLPFPSLQLLQGTRARQWGSSHHRSKFYLEKRQQSVCVTARKIEIINKKYKNNRAMHELATLFYRSFSIYDLPCCGFFCLITSTE